MKKHEILLVAGHILAFLLVCAFVVFLFLPFCHFSLNEEYTEEWIKKKDEYYETSYVYDQKEEEYVRKVMIGGKSVAAEDLTFVVKTSPVNLLFVHQPMKLILKSEDAEIECGRVDFSLIYEICEDKTSRETEREEYNTSRVYWAMALPDIILFSILFILFASHGEEHKKKDAQKTLRDRYIGAFCQPMWKRLGLSCVEWVFLLPFATSLLLSVGTDGYSALFYATGRTIAIGVAFAGASILVEAVFGAAESSVPKQGEIVWRHPIGAIFGEGGEEVDDAFTNPPIEVELKREIAELREKIEALTATGDTARKGKNDPQ